MHVLLFDIDGTLLSSGGAGRAAMELALAAEFGVPASSDGVTMSGRTDRSITRDLFRVHGIPESVENERRFVAAYLQQLPGSLARATGNALPGVLPLLVKLAERSDVAL